MGRILLLLLAWSVSGRAQTAAVLIREGQQQEAALHDNEAFLKYAAALRAEPDNLFALCRCSELSSRIGARQPSRDRKYAYFNAAKNYALTALRVNSNSSEANFVMAFALGRLSALESGREKIALVRDVKAYADRSIRLDPANFKPYHVLGRWNYDVSSLGMAERALAKIMYGGLPDASLDQAIACFEKSRQLNPSVLVNYFELARCWHRAGNFTRATGLLHTLLTMPDTFPEDAHLKDLSRQLLKEWK